MADEVLGNIYEAITKVAIEDYTTIVQPGETVFWGETPKSIGVKPDLTIGKDKDNPRILLLITHTNAERASDKKFWRNMGEFVDARIALGNKTSILSILFDSGQKRKLAIAQEAIFDGFLEADRTSYGAWLLSLCKKIEKKLGSNNMHISGRPALIREYLFHNIESQDIVKLLATDLQGLIGSVSASSQGWYKAFQEMTKDRPKPRIPEARVTTLRRGLGRLLPIDSKEKLETVLNSIRENKPTTVPEYFGSLGLTSKSLIGEVITDKEIVGLTELLDNEEIFFLWEKVRSASKSLSQACNAILKSDNFDLYHQFVVNMFDELVKPEKLKQVLLDCFEDPGMILGEDVGLTNSANSGVWLFDYIMTIIKAHSGKQQGYGYTKLAKEADLIIPGKRSIIDFELPLFLSRERFLSPFVCDGIVRALTLRMNNISKDWIYENCNVISSFYLRGIFEDKIYKAAALDPILLLISKNVELEITRRKRSLTFLTSFTGKGTATSDVLYAKKGILLWQSASDKGVTHKTKELCGRIGMLRVVIDDEGKVQQQKGLKKAILVVDGTWRQEQLNRLYKAGFDEIYYPDELEVLAESLS